MKSKALKAGIWYTISNFFIKGIVFITMPIFTRIMTKNDIGSFSNIASWIDILAIIVTFELYSSVNLAKYDYKDEIDAYISSNLFLGSLITSIFYIIVIVFSDFFLELFSIDMKILNLIFLYLLVEPAIQMFQVKNRITYNYKSSVIISIGSCLLSTILSLTCVFLFKNPLNGRIYGFYCPLIFVAIIIYIKLLLNGKSISHKYWKYALTISFPLIWHLLAGSLLTSSDRIMITKLIGTNENALYTIAYSCSMVVNLLWTSMNSAWSPWAYDMLEQKKYTELKNKSKPYFIFFLIIVLIFMLLAPDILLIMGGKNYFSAVFVIPPVMVGLIYKFVYSLYINIESFNKKQRNIAFSTMLAAIINIILNLIFIPIFGYIAAAYTTLIGYIFLFLFHWISVKKLKYDFCYDIKFFLKCLLISTFFIIPLNLLYIYNMVRYILIIFLFIYIIFKIVSYKSIIKQIIIQKSFKPIIDLYNKKMEKRLC